MHFSGYEPTSLGELLNSATVRGDGAWVGSGSLVEVVDNAQRWEGSGV